MKKIMLLVFVWILVIGTSVPVLASNINDYNQDIDLKSFQDSVIMSLNSNKSFVDGLEVWGEKPILENGRTLVPLRFIAENMQAKVDWQPLEQKVQVNLGDKKVSLTVGSKDMFVAGEKIRIDVPAKLKKGTTYLPLRAIGDALGKCIEYKNDSKFIIISNKEIDLNMASQNTLKAAFDDNYKVLYGDNWVVIAEKNDRLYGWDLNNGDTFIDLGDNFSVGRLKEGNVRYLSFHIGDNIMSSDQIFAVYPDKKVKYIYSTDLLDMKEKDGYLYMLVENNYGGLINDSFEAMEKFSGNLIRININEAIEYHETAENNVSFKADSLGVPGYFYGVYPTVGKYYDTDKIVVTGLKTNNNGYLFDWEIKDDGIYTVGVDFTSGEADKTIAKYKIPFTDRSHEKIATSEIETPPETEAMKKIVYLSPSTQERNIGYGKYGTEEYRMNQVGDVVQEILEKNGVTVFRNKPEWSLSQVVDDSNSKKADIHFAIHSNAGGGRGCEIYAYAPGGEGEKIARSVYKELEPLTPTADRGVKFNSAFYELRKTTAPAALVEVAYHDHQEDAEWIMNNIKQIGQAIAQGILKYFGIPMER